VALLDGQVMPEQYTPERIRRDDVQTLLRKVHVRPAPDLSARFPHEVPCRLTVRLRDSRILSNEKRDYAGFRTRPIGWDAAVRKFESLTEPHTTVMLQKQIVEVAASIENTPASRLTELLQQVASPAAASGHEGLYYGGS